MGLRLLALTLLVPIFLVISPSVAAAPTIRIECGIPNPSHRVACQLSGQGFYPRERLRVTYQITFTSLPGRRRHLSQQWYERIASSDRFGTFTRPPLTFSVVAQHESFRLAVTVIGAAGDRARTMTVVIAQ